jgi:hypothetical protein
MEGLFDNIFYLIPIAFFIAIRIINARNAGGRNSQKEKSSADLGELVKKIQEAGNPARQPSHKKPVYGKAVEAQKKSTKKPAVKVSSGLSNYRSAFPDATAGEDVSGQRDAAGKTKSDKAASGPQTGIVKPGLTPLQQAVVWAEILGQPKGA